MNFLATRRPQLALARKLRQPANYDVIGMVVATVFLFVWSAIAIYWEVTKGAQP